ncbi:hypothetical protein [Acetoanaerobium pronyense]|nr:hypothetical protein [Acetoanaerobium pronyense]
MKKITKENFGKIKEQILAISTLVTAIGTLLTVLKPIADFVLTVLFEFCY